MQSLGFKEYVRSIKQWGIFRNVPDMEIYLLYCLYAETIKAWESGDTPQVRILNKRFGDLFMALRGGWR